MKNLKNKVAALGMMAVLGLGTVSANAGMLISDRNANGQCGTVKDDILTQLEGIIIVGAPLLEGIIIVGRDGMLISDRNSGCTAKDGILISDRNGMLISD